MRSHCNSMDDLANEIGRSEWKAQPADRDAERRGGLGRCGLCGGRATVKPTVGAPVCHECGAVRSMKSKRWINPFQR
jgi:hypothetical protein